MKRLWVQFLEKGEDSFGWRFAVVFLLILGIAFMLFAIVELLSFVGRVTDGIVVPVILWLLATSLAVTYTTWKTDKADKRENS